MNKTKVTPDLLSMAQISAKTGISQRCLWRWIACGTFPKADVAVGRIRRWRTDTVEGWIGKQSGQE